MVSKAERRRSIFLTARTIFAGPTAQVRNRKAIAAVVTKHEAAFRTPSRQFGRDILIDVLSSLIENGIFESEIKAKLAFPELYQVSAARSLQHDASEQHAAQSEAEALDRLSLAHENDEEDQSDVPGDHIPEAGTVVEGLQPKPLGDLPSLYPAYLEYEVQHKLLNAVQSLLEQSCYSWAKHWLPGLLEERKWTCAEAIELTQWVRFVPQRFSELHNDATTLDSGTVLARTLRATHNLRHAAVHRLPTSARGLEKMLQSALDLVKSLCDTQTVFKIEHILKTFQEKVEEIELLKNQLENQLDEELHNIQEQKAALDRREKEVKADMAAKDHEQTTKLSWSLESSISKIIREDAKLREGEDQQASAKDELESVAEDVQVPAAEDIPDDKTLDSISQTDDCGGTSDEATGTQENYLDAKCEQSP